MNQATSRFVRLDPDTHRQAKITAAELGIPLSRLVGHAVDRELSRLSRTIERHRRTLERRATAQ